MAIQNQKMGFWTASSITVGNIVGSGAFALPATLSIYGNLSILGWLITAFCAMALSLVFAGLSSRVRGSGGPYTFAAKAFGRNFGFLVCYSYWVMSWISNAALIVIAVGFLSQIAPEFVDQYKFTLYTVIVLVVLKINLYGFKIAGIGEMIFTALKLVPLIVLPVIALFWLDFANLDFSIDSSAPHFASQLNVIIFATVWAFIGIETTTVPAGNISDSRKTLPKAIVFGTLVAAFIYIIGNITIVKLIPQQVLIGSNAPYADLAAVIFGGIWGQTFSIIGFVAVLATLNGWVMITGRIPEQAAKEGLFPPIFAKVNRDGTPVWGLVISSALSLAFASLTMSDGLIEQFNKICDASVTIILFVYLASILAFLKILKTNKELNFYNIFISIVSIAFCIVASFAISIGWLATCIAIILTAIPAHLLTKKYA